MLRIEDTDLERSTREFEEAMLKDLSGLVLIGMKVCLHPTVSLSFA